jgi:tetratricopeptide (TPR) repeat protein
MTFDEFIQTAWNDHAERPQDVAARVAASLTVIETPAQIPPFARLVTHVYGEHLGQWGRGIEILDSLRRIPAYDGSALITDIVARNIAVLRYASGDSAILELLSREDRVAVLATASSAFAGQSKFKQAISTYAEAVQLARSGLPPDSSAIRALAVGGNNLAAALEMKKDRDAIETTGMIAAAEGGLEFWKQAGSWLEEERAQYRLAHSLLAAGEYTAAIASAQRCIAICNANNAPAFELFFGHTTLARVQRAAENAAEFDIARDQARQLLARVAPEERQWCESEFEALDS